MTKINRHVKEFLEVLGDVNAEVATLAGLCEDRFDMNPDEVQGVDVIDMRALLVKLQEVRFLVEGRLLKAV